MQSPCRKRKRTCNSKTRSAVEQDNLYEGIDVSANDPKRLDRSSSTTVVAEDDDVEKVIAISSEEDVEDEDSNYYACGDVVPKTTAFVRELLHDAREQWGRKLLEFPPRVYIFSIKGSEIAIPRGIALDPQLVGGTFDSSYQTVETHVRAILARRQRPLFYIGSTKDLICRWRLLKDKHGRLVGHAFAKNIHWHTMLALYRTTHGDCCARMEENLLGAFNRKAFPHGCCQNVSMKANGVKRSSCAVHWVYICLPKYWVQLYEPCFIGQCWL